MKLPAWYHPFAEPHPMTNATAQYLLRRHKVSTVAELVKQAKKIQAQHQNDEHSPTPNCTCQPCTTERDNRCWNPHTCTTGALVRKHDLAPKYNPLQIGEQHDKLSLTIWRKTNNTKAKADDKEIIFNPSITCRDSIAECFKIFTDPKCLLPIPAG